MRVLHISMECFPAAKSGGLGDVVGALPAYLNRAGTESSVVIPKFGTPWLNRQTYREVYRDHLRLGEQWHWFSVEAVENDALGFPLYVVNIPGRFDRPGIYADPGGDWYGDETERSISFQVAVLKWVVSMHWKPRILHCHDHATGLIPFLVKYSPAFRSLHQMPTVFTIHNGEYHGAFSWHKAGLLPPFPEAARGLLDWSHAVSPLAAALKCCWRFTTVSPGYLEELRGHANGMEGLVNREMGKGRGILNGIDTLLWDPRTDPSIAYRLEDEDVAGYKSRNRARLLDRFRIIPQLPLIVFIGRLVREKGADLIPDVVRYTLGRGVRAGFVILGTGDQDIMHRIGQLRADFSGYCDVSLEYNEALAHQLYAGADFLFMPSRVEPCGLNQMYACRYGTVPIVRSTGGLRDTIPDVGDPGGRGFRFLQFSVEDAAMAIERAVGFHRHGAGMDGLRRHIMSVDFSWERAAWDYIRLYDELD